MIKIKRREIIKLAKRAYSLDKLNFSLFSKRVYLCDRNNLCNVTLCEECDYSYNLTNDEDLKRCYRRSVKILKDNGEDI
jgi:hypothetical protein